ncbi:MAG: NAD-dependent deacylase [Armatimonadetes bacterium]|nr:NAD-dependent deacylase [Armatimonadota bacterium]
MRILVFTGAGISAESGIQTFRASDGLWEEHRIEDVASPDGWRRDPELVTRFYNLRRRAVLAAEPNVAHKALAKLEAKHNVTVVTQNIDDLHERGGSSNVIHLHGEIFKVRSERNENLLLDWREDVQIGDKAPDGAQLRPHVVWFGEQILGWGEASEAAFEADCLIVVGTSAQVFPAAGLISMFAGQQRHFIDPNVPEQLRDRFECHLSPATVGVPPLVERLLQ